MKTAWEYLRYSSLNQDDFTIENQHSYNMKWAESNQVIITRSFTDEAKSASVYAKEERPDFERLILAVERGDQVDFILFFVVDRYARNDWDFARLKHAIDQRGGKVQIVYTGQFIPEGAEGMLLEGVLQKYAIFQSQHLSKIVRGGMRTNQSKCLHTGGTPALGFSVVESDPDKPGKHKKFTVNPEEAPAVVCIFESMAVEWNCKRAAKIANERGFRKRNGNQFNANDVWYLVRNRKYWGVYEAGKYTSEGVNLTLEGILPVFIPQKYLDAVDQQLKVKDVVTVAKTREGGQIWILTGKIVCGECGRAYSGNSWLGGRTGQVRSSYYQCGGYKPKQCDNKPIKKDLIESHVIDLIFSLYNPADQDQLIDAIMRQYQERIRGNGDDAGRLEKELADTSKKIQNLLSSIEAGIPAETVAGRVKELNAAKKVVEAQLERAKTTAPTLTREMVREYLEVNKATLKDRMDPAECKKLVQNYIDKITLYKNKVHIAWKFDKAKTPRHGAPGVKDLVEQVGFLMVDLRVLHEYPRPQVNGKGKKKKPVWVKNH
jgi:site-specific DNA recombinase